jgi:hypothetical protein
MSNGYASTEFPPFLGAHFVCLFRCPAGRNYTGYGYTEFAPFAPHVRVVYVKDVQRPSRFLPFGQGEFGRSGFFPLLARTNYRAPLSLHVEYEWAPKGQKTRARLVAALKENRRVLGQWWTGV